MISGLNVAATGGSGASASAVTVGTMLKSAAGATQDSQPAASSVVRLSASNASRPSSSAASGLYSGGQGSAAALAQSLRQAANQQSHPLISAADNSMNSVMLMLLIAQAKGVLSSAPGAY